MQSGGRTMLARSVHFDVFASRNIAIIVGIQAGDQVMSTYRQVSWPMTLNKQLLWITVWASIPVVWVTLSINKFGEKAWNNSVQHRWTHSWKTNLAMPMHRDTAREKVVNSQSLQTVSFVSSIPLRAVHQSRCSWIAARRVCTLQIPVFAEEGRQSLSFPKGPFDFSFDHCMNHIVIGISRTAIRCCSETRENRL